MKLPPLLMAAALLFWGWQTGMLLFAVVLSLILEVPRWVKARWEVEDADFKRIRDLCSVLIVGGLAYGLMTRDAPNEIMEFFRAANFTARNRSMQEIMDSMYVFVQWWPLMFFPMIAAQAWNSADGTPFHIYSYLLSRRRKQGKPVSQARVDVSWPYFLIVLVAGSSGNLRSAAFYPALCGIVGWALLYKQPRRFPAWVWVALFAAVVAGGQWGHQSIRGLQSYLDGTISNWISNLTNRDNGRLYSRTAMGRIGRMKLSGRIVMRMKVEGAAPSLLRDCSFDKLVETTWTATGANYFDLSAEGENFETWRMLPDKTNANRATIMMTPASIASTWLSLPTGTTKIGRFAANEVRTNAFGFTWARQVPPFLNFTADFGPGPTADHPPSLRKEDFGWSDLDVPEAEQEIIRKIARELNLHRGTLKERTEAIMDYFSKNFTYSTWHKASTHLPNKGETALGKFLTVAHSGHCEYFGTATVLLLREAGIPARYANGYSVQEKADDLYLIRERHAHAWAIYWDDAAKIWRDLDTTPGGWAEADKDEGASIFESIRDWFSNLSHAFNLWRYTGEKGVIRKYILMIAGLLVVILIWRLVRESKRKKPSPVAGTPVTMEVIRQGIDSAFYQIEKQLAAQGLERRTGEALSNWLDRIAPLTPMPVAKLKPLLALHYRYRFDPVGLTLEELSDLASGARQWLAELSAPSIASVKP